MTFEQHRIWKATIDNAPPFKALICTEDETVDSYIRRAFVDSPHTIDLCTNPNDVAAAAVRCGADMIYVDDEMAGGDIVGVSHKLLKCDATCQVPVLVITPNSPEIPPYFYKLPANVVGFQTLPAGRDEILLMAVKAVELKGKPKESRAR